MTAPLKLAWKVEFNIKSSSPSGQPSFCMADTMMRIAVAGTNSLSLLIAHFLVEETSHQILVLSRSSQPMLSQQGYQVLQVDYNDAASLQHAVMGVDTVISTVTGPPGLALLQAAVDRGVRRFVPAEFEGRPAARSANDELDRGAHKQTIRQWLEYYKTDRKLEYSILSCGVLYERFGPGGLRSHRLGSTSSLDNEGDYIINVRTMVGQAPVYDMNNRAASVCLTAAEDVARFLVKAVDFARWPSELTVVGERLTVWELLDTVSRVRGLPTTSAPHTVEALTYELQMATTTGDNPRRLRALDHLATASGRYDFPAPGNLNRACRGLSTTRFEDWLHRVWAAEFSVVGS